MFFNRKLFFLLIMMVLCLQLIPFYVQAEFNVVINFDDGYSGIYQHALPLMEKYNLKGVVFMPTNFINRKEHLTLNQLKILHQKGWEIGSHTVNHPNLVKFNSKKLNYEIIESKKYLQTHILNEASYISFCSPMAVWNNKIKEITFNNYQIVRGNKLYNCAEQKEIPSFIRVILTNTNISHNKRWIKEAQQQDKTIILVFHEIGQGINKYYFPPDKFNKIAAFIKQYQKNVQTFRSIFHKE